VLRVIVHKNLPLMSLETETRRYSGANQSSRILLATLNSTRLEHGIGSLLRYNCRSIRSTGCAQGTKTSTMYCRQLPRVVRRDLRFASRQATACSFAKINPLYLRVRAYSTSEKGMPHWYADKMNNEALQKLDIDAIEAFSKQRFGDATTWSHDQLLKLMVCKFDYTSIDSVH
jgi:hypothetical protein